MVTTIITFVRSKGSVLDLLGTKALAMIKRSTIKEHTPMATVCLCIMVYFCRDFLKKIDSGKIHEMAYNRVQTHIAYTRKCSTLLMM